jgi:hypothetical protein
LAIGCSATEVLEVSGRNVVRTADTHLPLKSVSGVFSTLPGLPHYSHNYGLHNLGYGLGGYRSLGLSSVNIAPSPYSYFPLQNNIQNYVQRYSAIQPTYQSVQAIQPAYQTLQVEQPAVAQVAIARPALTIAQPQVFTSQHQNIHPVSAAIHQVGRTVEYRAVPFNDQPIVAQDVIVEPSDQPINIHFKSRSSTVRLSQEHIAGEPGSVEQTSSQDEPSKVVHEVVKPVIQEVREVIQPYRQLTQEVQPVVENVHTVVSHGEGVRQQYVAEPIQKAQIQTVQQVAVQPVAVQPVQQFVAQRVQVPELRQVQIQQVQPIQVEAQPLQYQTIQEVQPIAVRAYTQPIHQVVANQHIRQVVAPQVTRYAVQQPALAIRTNVREHVLARETPVQRGTDFVKYVESDN